jgi:hypothetical protein
VAQFLAVQNADGSGFADLTQDTGCASTTSTHPGFSPDGGRIVFAYGCQGSQSIDVLNLNPVNLQTLLTGSATVTYTSPAWSPDGSKIALTVVDANNPLGAIEIMNSDGTGLHAVTSGINGNSYQSPDWSPDGSKLVFIQTVPLKLIVESKADGTGLTLLPNPSRYDFLNPVWSPDGASLLADNGISNSAPMILMNADGSGPTELPIGSGHPSWQPEVTPKDTDLTIGTPANVTVNATTPSGATVTYPLPAVTDRDDATAPSPACSPPSGTVFAIGTTTVTCTAVDPADASSPASSISTVTVVGASGQLAALQAGVQGVGPGTSLSNQLGAAASDLAAGDTGSTCAQLGDFIAHVQAQSGKSIPQATAGQLIKAAQQIQAVLAC